MDNNTFQEEPGGPTINSSSGEDQEQSSPSGVVSPESTTDQPTSSGQDTQPAEPAKNTKQMIIGLLCLVVGIVIGSAIAIITTNNNKPTEEPDEPLEIDASSTEIDFNFLQLESSSENIVYSPLSIRNGLELLDAGASGDTKAEIDEVLGNKKAPKYQNIEDEISLANAVFIRDSFKDNVLPSYTSTVTGELGGEVILDSFESSNNMDKWVQEKTFGLINNIGVKPDGGTKMVLANALALQLEWSYGFDTDSTSGEDFYLNDGTTLTATTMGKKFRNNNIGYKTTDKYTTLSMPLDSSTEDQDLEFVAVMPSNDLDDYIENLTSESLNEATNDLTTADTPENGILVSIPKFSFEYELDFGDDLMSLGIESAFDEEADFSKMASSPLYVSDAIHKANIDFSEDGIKAAAVTAFTMKESSAMESPVKEEPIVIKIDHPFLFLIRDKKNDVVWFTGAVYQPNLWEDDVSNYR